MRQLPLILILVIALAGISFPLHSQHFLMEKDGSSFAIWTPPGGGTVPFLHFRNQSNSADWILRHDNSKFHIQTEGSPGSEKMTLLTNGNVGIGTTDPLQKLHVDGNTRSGNTFIGTWPAHSRYAFFSSSALDQTVFENYALLQDSQGASAGQTFLNSPVDIRFRIGNVDHMLLANDGEVGIGTTSPEAKLHVAKNSSSVSPQLLLQETDPGDYARLNFENSFNSNYWALAATNSVGDPEFNLYHNTFGNIISVQGTGEVGIHTTNPVAALHIKQPSAIYSEVSNLDGLRIEHHLAGTSVTFTWDIYASGGLYFASDNVDVAFINNKTGEFNQISDKSLKRHIHILSPILRKVMNLKPSQFQFKSIHDTSRNSIGFIAQEVEPLFPEIVSDNQGIKMLDYSKFGVIAIKAIQEQQLLIENLEMENGELEEKLSKMESRIAEIEEWMSGNGANSNSQVLNSGKTSISNSQKVQDNK